MRFDHYTEARVLGTLLLHPERMPEAQDAGLSRASFTALKYSTVYAALARATSSAQLNGDAVAIVLQDLERNGDLDVAGGPAAVIDLLEKPVAGAANLMPLVLHLVHLQEARTVGGGPGSGLSALSAAELCRIDIPPVESFIDEAVLPRGHVAMIHGKGGLGKSYLAIGLGVCLASDLPWLGLPTQHARTLMLTYEVPAGVMKMQVNEWCAALAVDQPEEFFVITMERLVTALLEAADGEPSYAPRERMIALCRQYRADVLILDPWRSCHHAEEQDSRAMSLHMEALRVIAAEARVALLILHHDRKGPGREQEESSDAARGSTAIRDAARSVAWLHASKGSLCLDFHKVNLGSKPEPVWLERKIHAPPTVGEAPEVESARGAKNRKRKLTEHMACHPDGTTVETAMAVLGVGEKTARRYIAELQTRNLRPMGDVGLYVLEGVGQ